MSNALPLTAIITHRLAEFLAGTDPALAGLRAVAMRLQALPLFAEAAGCFAIRPNGVLLFVHSRQDWFAVSEWTDQIDPAWRGIALAAGSHSYPELKPLLPVRGVEATDCGSCAARGWRLDSETGLGQLCGDCLGLGWRGG